MLIPMKNYASSGGAVFDKQRLKTLGLDPALADYFAKSNRFSPGQMNVDFIINGVAKGAHNALFNSDGDLCVNGQIIKFIGLDIKVDEKHRYDCVKITDYFKNAVIVKHPERNEIGFVVPPEALLDIENHGGDHVNGGKAAIVNYDMYSMSSKYGANSDTNEYIQLETGINFDDWIYRSHQTLSGQNGSMDFSNTDSYLLRSLPEYNKSFQIGELNFSSPVMSGFPFTGIQLVPENNVSKQKRNMVSISGISKDQSSKVNVYQNGLLVHSTIVPSGPFTLTDVPIISTTDDVHVEVSASGHITQSFNVPAFNLQQQITASNYGLAAAIGRIRLRDSATRKKDVMALSDDWYLNKNIFFDFGVIKATQYFNSGAALTWRPYERLSFKNTTTFSNDSNTHSNGIKNDISASWGSLNGLSLNASAALSSSGYRTLLDAQSEAKFSYELLSWSFGMNFSTDDFGAISANINSSQSKYNNENYSSRNINLTWSKQLPVGAISLNWQRQTRYIDSQKTPDDIIYVNYSFSIKDSNNNLYYHNNKSSQGSGISTSGNLTKNNQYTLSVENDNKDRSVSSVSGGINSNLHYTNLAITADHSGMMQNISGAIAGGLVAHANGLTFSSYKIDDTFGIAHLVPPEGGIEIETPDGSVYTDFAGNAIIPRLAPRGLNVVELNTEALPQEIDVPHGIQQVSPERGAVVSMDFDIKKSRRVMLIVTPDNNYKLSTGSYLTTSKNSGYITTAVDNGYFFINDISGLKNIYAHPVQHPDAVCKLVYTLPERNDENTAYEEIYAQCI